MKNRCLLTLFPTLSILSSFSPCFANEFVSIQKLVETGLVQLTIRGTGGHTGQCVAFDMNNLRRDSTFVWIEAGRRLDSDNPGEQDIFVVKHQTVRLGPGEKLTIPVDGVCCQATNSSPGEESGFSLGKMAPDAWVVLANYISAFNFPTDVIQHAVWVMSDDHDIRSIPAIQGFSTQGLREKVAEILDIDLPWYSFDYVDDSTRLFSGDRSHIFAEVPYEIPFHAVIGGVIYDATGKIVYESPKYNARTGKNIFVLNASIEGWQNGNYKFEILEDFHTVNQYRTFVLDGNG